MCAAAGSARRAAVFSRLSAHTKNTRGRHLYCLIRAGPRPLGLSGAKHIVSKGQKIG